MWLNIKVYRKRNWHACNLNRKLTTMNVEAKQGRIDAASMGVTPGSLVPTWIDRQHGLNVIDLWATSVLSKSKMPHQSKFSAQMIPTCQKSFRFAIVQKQNGKCGSRSRNSWKFACYSTRWISNFLQFAWSYTCVGAWRAFSKLQILVSDVKRYLLYRRIPFWCIV